MSLSIISPNPEVKIFEHFVAQGRCTAGTRDSLVCLAIEKNDPTNVMIGKPMAVPQGFDSFWLFQFTNLQVNVRFRLVVLDLKDLACVTEDFEVLPWPKAKEKDERRGFGLVNPATDSDKPRLVPVDGWRSGQTQVTSATVTCNSQHTFSTSAINNNPPGYWSGAITIGEMQLHNDFECTASAGGSTSDPNTGITVS